MYNEVDHLPLLSKPYYWVCLSIFPIRNPNFSPDRLNQYGSQQQKPPHLFQYYQSESKIQYLSVTQAKLLFLLEKYSSNEYFLLPNRYLWKNDIHF